MVHASLTIPHEDLKSFCEHHGIVRLALFGSATRQDFTPASDVDVLIALAPDRRIGLMGLNALEAELSALLGRKVDLHTFDGLHPRMRPRVLAELEDQYVRQ